jgi:hypothetical protein
MQELRWWCSQQPICNPKLESTWLSSVYEQLSKQWCTHSVEHNPAVRRGTQWIPMTTGTSRKLCQVEKASLQRLCKVPFTEHSWKETAKEMDNTSVVLRLRTRGGEGEMWGVPEESGSVGRWWWWHEGTHKTVESRLWQLDISKARCSSTVFPKIICRQR